eukprot:6212964-Pleurochrysis_carterae.AAC.3
MRDCVASGDASANVSSRAARYAIAWAIELPVGVISIRLYVRPDVENLQNSRRFAPTVDYSAEPLTTCKPDMKNRPFCRIVDHSAERVLPFCRIGVALYPMWRTSYSAEWIVSHEDSILQNGINFTILQNGNQTLCRTKL